MDNRKGSGGKWVLVFVWLLCCKLFMVDATPYFKVTFEMGKEFKSQSHPFLKHEQERVTSTALSEIVVKGRNIWKRKGRP